jgi:hypothetical protein
MGLRRMVSLLQAHGHSEARFYPVPNLWLETKIVRQRVNRDLANSSILTQMAVSSMLSEKAGKAFDKRVKELLET